MAPAYYIDQLSYFYSDGTLITQRFHFANDPHPYRHVLGWYRLTHELREAGVHAICIFDGKERSAAKQGEVSRASSTSSIILMMLYTL